MGKAIGLLLAVVAIWITVEIYTSGADGAFGGRLSSLIGSGDAPPESTAKRTGAAVERAHEEHEARYGELIPE